MPQERGGAPLRFFSKPRARAYNVHERDFARACAYLHARPDIRSWGEEGEMRKNFVYPVFTQYKGLYVVLLSTTFALLYKFK